MKFSQKCKTNKLGMIYTILESFLIGKGPIFGPKTGLGKSLTLTDPNSAKCSGELIKEH